MSHGFPDWQKMYREANRERVKLREENADLRKKLSDLEMQNINTEPTPSFFNAENTDYLKSGLDVTHRRIDKLADRVAMLERVRWMEEGEL